MNTDWQRKKLSDIFEFKNGLNKEKEFFGYGTPIVNYMDVNRGGGLYQEDVLGRVSVNKSELARFDVKRGDVFFTRTSETLDEIGFSAVALDDFRDTVFSGFVLRARPKTEYLLPEFAKYCFRTHVARKEIKEKSSYTTRALTSGSLLNHVNIQLPLLVEQKRIVSVLETWDKAIALLEKKIEHKKQVKKGLMQQLLTGKKRLPGFDCEWGEFSIESVSKFINGYAFKSSSYVEGGDYKIITIANVQDGFMDSSSCKTVSRIPKDINTEQVLSRGDILVSMTGNVGRVCLVNIDDCLLNQRVGKIIPVNIDYGFLYSILTSAKFNDQMISGGQGGAQANLSTADIKGFKFIAPSEAEEQAGVASVFDAVNREVSQLENKLILLKDQKKFLLNNLVTGKIRTPKDLKF